MSGMVTTLRRRLDRLALPLGLLGMAGVAAWNWRQWQRDKERLAALRNIPPRPPLADWPALPKVSVLVAAWNEADFIERHIAGFRALRYPHKELVLCAGGEDGTFEKALRHAGPDVIVLQQEPGEGKQRALARAFPQTTGEIIFLTDADCLLDDDAFERTLLPVAAGEEQVCTGGSRPLEEQLANPLVRIQAASDKYMYSDGDAPAYLPGLLGRNCALCRKTLIKIDPFAFDAPTGTDYVLAKVLNRNGTRIFQRRDSQIQTAYPECEAQYVQQQRRWLRNVALHGHRFGEAVDVSAALMLSSLGIVLFMTPFLSVFFGFWILIPWFLLLLQGALARKRYLSFHSQAFGGDWDPVPASWLFKSLFLDAAAWVLPLTDFWSARRTNRW